MKLAHVLLFLLLPNLLQAQELTGTLAHIRDTGEVAIGYRTTHPPVSFADSAGLPTGYSVEICKRIASDLGDVVGRDDIQTEFVAVTAQNRFDAIEDGTIDILCGATTKTLSRSERVGFTQLTVVTGATFLSLDANRINSVEDLAGQRVAVTEGTTTETALTSAVSQAQVETEIMTVSSSEEALAALQNGEVAAYAADQIVLIGQVVSQRDTEFDYFLSSNLFSFEPYALAIRRGDPDFALAADRTLSRLYRSGQILPIYERYFGPFGLKPPSALLAMYRLMSTPE